MLSSEGTENSTGSLFAPSCKPVHWLCGIHFLTALESARGKCLAVVGTGTLLPKLACSADWNCGSAHNQCKDHIVAPKGMRNHLISDYGTMYHSVVFFTKKPQAPL